MKMQAKSLKSPLLIAAFANEGGFEVGEGIQLNEDIYRFTNKLGAIMRENRHCVVTSAGKRLLFSKKQEAVEPGRSQYDKKCRYGITVFFPFWGREVLVTDEDLLEVLFRRLLETRQSQAEHREKMKGNQNG